MFQVEYFSKPSMRPSSRKALTMLFTLQYVIPTVLAICLSGAPFNDILTSYSLVCTSTQRGIATIPRDVQKSEPAL